MGFIWTIIIGFVAGVIAKFIMPGENEPSGFILTTLLSIFAPSSPHTSAKRWAGIRQMKARGCSERCSAPSSCWRSGNLSPVAEAQPDAQRSLFLDHDLFRHRYPPRIKSGAGFFGIML